MNWIVNLIQQHIKLRVKTSFKSKCFYFKNPNFFDDLRHLNVKHLNRLAQGSFMICDNKWWLCMFEEIKKDFFISLYIMVEAWSIPL